MMSNRSYEYKKNLFEKELSKFNSRQEMFNHHLRYEDGELYRKTSTRLTPAGKKIGSRTPMGIQVSVSGLSFGRSLIIHEMHFGSNPSNLMVGHLDKDIYNDKLENLFLENNNLKSLTEKIHRTNTSGYKGVSFNKCVGKWHAYIGVSNRRIDLGYYHDIENAIEIRREVFDSVIALNKEEIKEIIRKYKERERYASNY